MILTRLLLLRMMTVLERADAAMARRVRPASCRYCGGPVHAAHYWRKAWGVPAPEPGDGADARQLRRWSWCCGRRGCRKRMTPVSWRFFGRRFYVAPVVVTQTAQATHPDIRTQDLPSPARRTIRRWLAWWTTVFATSPLWQTMQRQLTTTVVPAQLPGALIPAVAMWSPTRLLLSGLALIQPWTGGVVAP